MKKNAEVRRYSSFADDFVTTKDQDHRLPEDYRWIRTDVRSRFLSALSYGAALVISSVWCRAALHVRLHDRKLLRAARDGAFIYANHTQPVGDVFIPALASFPRRIYTVVSPANLGIPVIGRILPYLGALPIPDTLGGMRGFTEAVKARADEGCNVVIYPEAHVWEYYTGIRPMPESAFTFPVRCGKPSYAMTVTYKKRCIGKKPAAMVHLDGPFYPDESLPPRRRAAALRDTVYAAMLERSRESDTEYIRYEPAGAGNMDIQERSNTAVTEKG